jgi:hypothetical protein
MSSVRSAMCWQPGDRYQRAVLGVDDLVVVMDELGESQHVLVEIDEGVHLSELDVAHAVVDLEQAQPTRRTRRCLHLPVARRECTVVVTPIDERVEDRAVRPDRRPPEDAILAAVELGRLERGDGSAARGLAPGRLDVRDAECDVVHAIAMLSNVFRDLAIRGQRRGEHEADVVLDHDVAGAVTDLGLEAAICDWGEAPQRAVVGGRLAGVADPELDVVDAVKRQEIARFGIGVRIDPGAGLIRRAPRKRFGHRASLRCMRVRPRRAAPGEASISAPIVRRACHTGGHE